MTQAEALPTEPKAPALSRSVLFLLAFCAGASVANLYYAQPLLALIGQTFHAPTSVGLISTATQIGYTLGILFILPLGDLVERRRLTVVLASVLAVATLACAFAPSFQLLMLTSLFVGVSAIITQIMVPLATDLAAPEQRGRAVGIVFSGILAGILLARTFSGLVGQAFGWRPMFVVASVVAVVLGIILFKALPRLAPKTRQSYLSLYVSMGRLMAKYPSLRTACAIQACLFGVFSAFWTILALLLAQSPFNLGPAAAGAFGIVGLVGVGAANVSGRLIDRFGSKLGLRIGLACCVAAWAIFSLHLSLVALIAGVLLLDFGLSVANVSNQSQILGLEPDARSRINTLYVTSTFIGGSIGSASASIAWAHGGWSAVCAFGLGAAVLAGLIHLATWVFGRRSVAVAV